MWAHGGFANYPEGLHTECRFGKQAGAEYTVGSRFNLQGERPIVIEYGVNAEPPGLDLSKVFVQYLRTTQIPVFNYRIARDALWYRWQSVVPGFDLPVRVTVSPGELAVISPGARWRSVPLRVAAEEFRVDANFYVPVLREP
jgi:hypothetical protein